jgi:ribose/xylose/arabinose/galactoside ABC-type transport system permease subunit
MTQQNAIHIEPHLYFNENRQWRIIANALWVVLILAILGCVSFGGSAASEAFWSSANMRNLVQAWLLQALMVPPMALIIAAGGLDLSAGAVAGLVATVIASRLTSETGSAGSALVLGLFLALLIGLANGLLAGLTRIHGAIITFGMTTLLSGINFMATEGQFIAVREVGFLSSLTLTVIVLILLILLTIVLIEFTPFGRRRPSESERGEPWFQRLLFVGTPYVLSSLMAGLAGAWLLGRLRAAGPNIGVGLETDVILMVLLGGTAPGSGLANIIGGIVAAFLVGTAQNISVINQVPVQAVLLGKGAALLFFGLFSYLDYQIVNWVFRRRKVVAATTQESETVTISS